MRLADRHTENIRISSYLSKLPRVGWELKKNVKRLSPDDVMPSLQAAEIDFVLAGAHGLAGWLENPRATQDVDFLIAAKSRKKAASAILKKYPELIVEEHPVVWRFMQDGKCVIDLMFTHTPFFKRVFKEFLVKKAANRREFKIPKLEAALAMKFAAMVGPMRNDEKKHLDAHDFISMVKSNAAVDTVLLRELGELVYEGGGKEIVKMVEDVRAGRKLEL